MSATAARRLLHRLISTGTVYTRGGSGARVFDVVDTSVLRCRLLPLPLQNASTGPERAALASMRQLVWPPDYTLPAACQIEIDGVRWNPIGQHAVQTVEDLDGVPMYRRVDVQRVVS